VEWCLRVLIIDQYPLIRDAVTTLLLRSHPSALIVTADTVLEALATPWEDDPALIVCDAFAEEDPVEALQRLRSWCPDAPILVLSDPDDQNDISRIMQAGATAFVRKTDSVVTVSGAIRLCLGGGAYISSSRESGVAGRTGLSQDGGGFSGPHLTARQLEVLNAISRGLSNRGIAGELGLAEGTVKIHVAAIFKALGVSNRTQAVLAGSRAGLVWG
jgi:DNA-binding NarL/FixJ family response regulator